MKEELRGKKDMIFGRKKVSLETISELETKIASLERTISDLERENSNLQYKIALHLRSERSYIDRLAELKDLHRKELDAGRERYSLLLERYIAMMEGRLDNEQREAD